MAALCVSMTVPQAYAAGTTGTSPSTARKPRLTEQQKTLHALNRLTFGPRPGDEQAVTREGLEKWFERQLHPEAIDDAAFEQRLKEFPSLNLPPAELVRRFPSPLMMRTMAKRRVPMPSDPVERAIYQDSMGFYFFKMEAPSGVAGDMATPKPTATDKKLAAEVGLSATPEAKPKVPADAYQEPVLKDPSTLLADGTGDHGAYSARNVRYAGPPMSNRDVLAVVALPPEQRMARLLAMTPKEMIAFRNGLGFGRVPLLIAGLSPAEREDVLAFQGPQQMLEAEVLQSRILRDVYSERQLQAVMDDFWLNHFSVYDQKAESQKYLLASYEHDAVLPNVLGKFEDLLVANAKSPAMQLYLDNWESVGPHSQTAVEEAAHFAAEAKKNKGMQPGEPRGLNENYGRELMELHTLGVDGGYTQKDVIEVSKCFTGWGIDRTYDGGTSEFLFNPKKHEPGPKTVLGHVIQEDGINEGLQVLHILATSPATAHFVSNKLAMRFVSDTPPPALVARMAATFLRTGGDIKAVMTTMFRSPEFWAPTVYRAKVKTPIEFLASALRASDAATTDPAALVQEMSQLGMPIYGMMTPDGYSWLANHWVSSNALVSRMNFALVLSMSKVPGTKTDWPRLLGETQAAADADMPTPKTELTMETLILGQAATPRTRESVLHGASRPDVQKASAQASEATQPAVSAFVPARRPVPKPGDANAPETPLGMMAGLLIGSPDFQRR